MTSPPRIDGSHGEGGGQIVRTSLALAIVTGRGVAIDNIRAGRKEPGLKRQHLTAVNAAAEICGGRVTGAAVRSRAVTLEPGPVRPGNYHFNVGSAGSATLVLQTVLPALLIADGPSSLILEGGTHNPWSPPFDFLQRVYLPLVERMGPRVIARLERPGFYPKGGGRFVVSVQPSPTLRGFDLLERGEIVATRARVLLSNLPPHIAERELDTVVKKLRWRRDQCAIDELPSHGPGNVLTLEVESEHATELCTAFGRLGIRAEQVAREAIADVEAYLATDAPVGPHLADQLLLPLGLSARQARERGEATGGGSFRTLPLTEHSTTHIELLRTLLDIQIEVTPAPDAATCTVRVSP
ncbi:MAG: RNA 3'-terminal phosphate cyclase [Planctomycetaceae bacterium]|nr:RNA 3'-terminal phosphate cyclase [Planctomycetaceae bacterium]